MSAQRSHAVDDPLIQHTLLGEAIDRGPAAIFVVGEDRRYVAVNETACSLLGYSRGELLGLGPADLAPGPWVDERFAELARTGTLAGTADLRAKDGSVVRVTYRTSETTVAHMRFWISVALPDR
jgi:PAS domain S-box-containing protein